MKKSVLRVIEPYLQKKGIEMTGFLKDKLRDLDRDFSNEKVDVDGVITKLQDLFSYKLDRRDYEAIKKELSR